MRHVLLIALLAWCCISIQAQMSLAAVVETTFAGVEVQLKDTDQWITLPDGSNTPLGAEDTIRTDLFGRARITFGDNSTLLLLSGSTFTLHNYTATGDTATVQATVEGISIQNIADTLNLDLQAAEMSIRATDADFAVWSRPDKPHTVTVAEGIVSVSIDDETWDVSTGEGYHSVGDERVIAIDEPYNQAYIIGEQEGCVETVSTLNGTPGVLVRTGAGSGYQRRGFLDNGTEIPLLAKTFSSYWTRIQYGNGFGWVITDAVRSDCDLEILPDDTPEEDFTRATNADEQELEMLLPFYGNPLLDSWFYQIIQE